MRCAHSCWNNEWENALTPPPPHGCLVGCMMGWTLVPPPWGQEMVVWLVWRDSSPGRLITGHMSSIFLGCRLLEDSTGTQKINIILQGKATCRRQRTIRQKLDSRASLTSGRCRPTLVVYFTHLVTFCGVDMMDFLLRLPEQSGPLKGKKSFNRHLIFSMRLAQK